MKNMSRLRVSERYKVNVGVKIPEKDKKLSPLYFFALSYNVKGFYDVPRPVGLAQGLPFKNMYMSIIRMAGALNEETWFATPVPEGHVAEPGGARMGAGA